MSPKGERVKSHRELHEALLAPGPLDCDRESAEEQFRVGEFWYRIDWTPAIYPAWFLRLFEGPLAFPAALLIAFPLAVIASQVEPRGRLSISRRRNRRPFWQTISIEFFAEDEPEGTRALEIRKKWVFGQYEEAKRVAPRQSFAVYRQARREVPRPAC